MNQFKVSAVIRNEDGTMTTKQVGITTGDYDERERVISLVRKMNFNGMLFGILTQPIA